MGVENASYLVILLSYLFNLSFNCDMTSNQEVPKSDSCNQQTAVFGGTSCTVHNYPNNNGSVAYSETSQLVMMLTLVAIVVAVLLYCMCKLYLQHRGSPVVSHVQPAMRTYSRPESKTKSTETRDLVPEIEVV